GASDAGNSPWGCFHPSLSRPQTLRGSCRSPLELGLDSLNPPPAAEGCNADVIRVDGPMYTVASPRGQMESVADNCAKSERDRRKVTLDGQRRWRFAWHW